MQTYVCMFSHVRASAGHQLRQRIFFKVFKACLNPVYLAPHRHVEREREREREFRVHLGSPVELNLHLPLAMSGWNSGQGPIVQNILSCKFDEKVLEKSKFHHFLGFQTFIWNDNILDCKQPLVSHSYKSVVHYKWTFLCRARIRTHDLPDTMTDLLLPKSQYRANRANTRPVLLFLLSRLDEQLKP